MTIRVISITLALLIVAIASSEFHHAQSRRLGWLCASSLRCAVSKRLCAAYVAETGQFPKPQVKIYRLSETNEYLIRVYESADGKLVLRESADAFEADKESAIETAMGQLIWLEERA
jgi:hypothetical protein